MILMEKDDTARKTTRRSYHLFKKTKNIMRNIAIIILSIVVIMGYVNLFTNQAEAMSFIRVNDIEADSPQGEIYLTGGTGVQEVWKHGNVQRSGTYYVISSSSNINGTLLELRNYNCGVAPDGKSIDLYWRVYDFERTSVGNYFESSQGTSQTTMVQIIDGWYVNTASKGHNYKIEMDVFYSGTNTVPPYSLKWRMSDINAVWHGGSENIEVQGGVRSDVYINNNNFLGLTDWGSTFKAYAPSQYSGSNGWQEASFVMFSAPSSRVYIKTGGTWGAISLLPLSGPEVFSGTFVDSLTNQTFDTKYCQAGKSFAAPTPPSHEGYTFTGWSDTLSNIWSNKTIKANYRLNEYTVKYNANAPQDEIVGTTIDTRHTYNEVKALSDNGYKYYNHHFIGWSKTPGATKPDYMAGENVVNLSVSDGATVDLYAVWEENPVYEYDDEGYALVPVSTITLTESNNWHGEFENVEKFDENGNESEFVVRETPIIGWSPTIEGNTNGFNITNKPSRVVEINKVWTGLDYSRLAKIYTYDIQDGIDVRIDALREDGKTDSFTYNLNGEMNSTGDTVWTTKVNVPYESENGISYKSFSISEVDDLHVLSNPHNPTDISDLGYRTTISGSVEEGSITVTNTLVDASAPANMTISKTWSGDGEKYDVTIDIKRQTWVKDKQFETSYVSANNNNTENKRLLTVRSNQADEILDIIATNNGQLSLGYQDENEKIINIASLSPNDLHKTIMLPNCNISGTFGIICNGIFFDNMVVTSYNLSNTENFDSQILDESNSYQCFLESFAVCNSFDGDVSKATEIYTYYPEERNDNNAIQDDGRYYTQYSETSAYGEKHEMKTPDNTSICLYGDRPSIRYEINNSFIRDSIDIPVNKIWVDENNAYDTRPDEVRVHLLANEKEVSNAILNTANMWHVVFEDLEAFDAAGTAIQYSIEEERVSHYSKGEISGSALTGFNVTNTLPITSIRVSKTWQDDNNAAAARPDFITVWLKKNDETTHTCLTLDASNDWNGVIEGLLALDENGIPYKYSIEEDKVEHYKTTVTENGNILSNRPIEFTLTNTLDTRDIDVSKQWERVTSYMPESVNVVLRANGVTVNDKQIVLSESNGWHGTFQELPMLDSNGNLIQYSVEEVLNEQDKQRYSSETAGDMLSGFVITNIEKLQIPVYKTWLDYDDADGIRPDAITVHLINMDSGEIISNGTLSAATEWKYLFDNVDKIDSNGNEISYGITEDNIPGYITKSISGDVINGFSIVNEHSIEYTSVNVKKIWDDDDNQDGVRPSQITLFLMKNGSKVAGTEKVLSSGDDGQWQESELSCTWDKLKVSENGMQNVYSVGEEPILKADGSPLYTADTMFASDGVIYITNKHVPDTFDLSVEKIWAQMPSGITPQPVKVNLLRNGERVEGENGSTWTIFDAEAQIWKASFERLPLKDENGEIIEYSVEEDPSSCQAIIDSSSLADSTKASSVISPTYAGSTEEQYFVIFNRFKSLSPSNEILGLERHVSVTKLWQGGDSNNRPSVIVSLYANGNLIEGSTKTLTDNDGWHYDYGELPAIDNEGEDIIYTVKEEPVQGYETEYTVNGDNKFEEELVVVNYAKKVIDVDKIWNDDNDSAQLRPNSIKASIIGYRLSNAKKLLLDSATGHYLTGVSPSDNFVGICYVNENERDIYAVLHAPSGIIISKSLIGSIDVECDGNGKGFEVGRIDDGLSYFTFEYDDGMPVPSTVIERAFVHDGQRAAMFKNDFELTANNGWHTSFNDLDDVDAIGLPMNYEIVEEGNIFGYSSTINKTNSGFEIVNTLLDNISVNKQWIDGEQELSHTENIIVGLYRNGEKIDEIVLSEDNKWSDNFQNIVWRDTFEQKYSYEIKEENCPNGYIPIIENNIPDTMSATLYNIRTTQIPVKKIWEDDNNSNNTRPSEISYSLTPWIDDIISLPHGPSSDVGNSYTAYRETWDSVIESAFSNAIEEYGEPFSSIIKVKNSSNSGIGFSIESLEEKTHQNVYIESGEENTIKIENSILNTGKISISPIAENDITFDKAIFDGLLSIDIITTYKGEEKNDTVSASNDWQTVTPELMLSDTHGRLIRYSMNETNIPSGYDSTCSLQTDEVTPSYVITNVLDKTSVEVSKVWKDGANADGIRPDSVEVELIASGIPTGNTLILSSDNDWNGRFAHLDIYDENGNTITYSIKENNVPQGYTSRVYLQESSSSQNKYVVENTHELLVNIPVVKKWDDIGNLLKTRPHSLEMAVISNPGQENEKIVATAQISGDYKSSEWNYIFEKLPYLDSSGKVVTYEVRESMPDGYYQLDKTGDIETGVTFTNKSSLIPLSMPATGTSISIILVVVGIIMVVAGCFFTLMPRVERKTGVNISNNNSIPNERK